MGVRVSPTPLRKPLWRVRLQQVVLAPLSRYLGGSLGPLRGRFFSKYQRGGTRLLKVFFMAADGFSLSGRFSDGLGMARAATDTVGVCVFIAPR